MGLPLVRLGWRPPGLSMPLPPFSSTAPQNPEDFFMMAYNNDIGLDPVGDPTCLRKQKVGKPSRNAAPPYAKAEGCVYEDPSRADGLRKGWPFRVDTWNVDSLTRRSGELVEALGERRIDIACVQEIRWRGSSCRYFGATGKRYKLFWMGTTTTTI